VKIADRTREEEMKENVLNIETGIAEDIAIVKNKNAHKWFQLLI
jgi:hypothetical protein